MSVLCAWLVRVLCWATWGIMPQPWMQHGLHKPESRCSARTQPHIHFSFTAACLHDGLGLRHACLMRVSAGPLGQRPPTSGHHMSDAKLVVNSFAQLVCDGIYTHSLSSKEAFARVLRETRHLQQSRKDEFARALTDYAQHAEPDQEYELREDLRMQLTKDKKITEHDVVVKGKDKAYVGSHKTHVKGATPVKEIAERCQELASLPNELPSKKKGGEMPILRQLAIEGSVGEFVKPAFMVERPEPGAEPRVQKACTDFKVVRFRRSGHAIQLVNRMGAADRLLRF